MACSHASLSRLNGISRLVTILVLWAVILPAYAADHDTYREALVAGDPARLSALIVADQRRLPVDEAGVTVLHRALHVYSGQQLEMVRRLIAAGSDVNATTRDGATPLHWACRFGVEGAVPLLLAAGARIDARDEDGVTPLFSARTATAKLLIAAGADPLARDREGNVPLHRNASPELLAPGVNVRNTAGLTPLHYAALAGNITAIEWLLTQGADAKARTTAATHWRSGLMSKAFGPGERVPAGATALDLARAQHRQARFNTSRYLGVIQALEKAR
jgi:ankyrin repeat protein